MHWTGQNSGPGPTPSRLDHRRTGAGVLVRASQSSLAEKLTREPHLQGGAAASHLDVSERIFRAEKE